MTRRFAGRMAGERWLGNEAKKEVHDLDRETKECLIHEIMDADNDVAFITIEDAHEQGYTDCPYCVDLEADESCKL